MGKFDFPYYEPPETDKAKVTPIIGGEVTPEEEAEAFEDLYNEIFGGKI